MRIKFTPIAALEIGYPNTLSYIPQYMALLFNSMKFLQYGCTPSARAIWCHYFVIIGIQGIEIPLNW